MTEQPPDYRVPEASAPGGGDTTHGGGSSTGLDTRLAGLLCYLLGFLSGILFLVLEKRDREVRFHAYQSTMTFVSLFVLSVVSQAVPLIGWLAGTVIWLGSLVLWLLLMYKAFNGERFKLPTVGDWAEEQAGLT